MDADFRRHLMTTFGLSAGDADRLLAEVAARYGQTVDGFVRERHAALKRRGLKNEAIYRTIIAEAQQRRFAAEPLTERQIRRLIYG